MKMVDVGAKPKTERVAVASAEIRMAPATLARIREGRIEKGNVLEAARLAGVMAVKRTPDLIPLCHPISVSAAHVELSPVERADASAGLAVRAEVRTVDRTGVEMEALCAVTAAALTVYDMCKSIDRGMEISAVRLERKAGGRSGTWERKPQP